MLIDFDEARRSARRTASFYDLERCDSCGGVVWDPTRARHPECPPPPLPQAFYEAKAKAAEIAAREKASRRR